MSPRRGDPRRVGLLVVLTFGAAAWAWYRSDDVGTDVFRFIGGVAAGLVLAVAIRSADGVLARHHDFATRSRLSAASVVVGPALGVLAAAVLARSGALGDSDDVLLAGGFAGLLLGVGVLYPIP